MSKIDELGELELTDNIALKKYLDTLRKLCYDLYIEVHWAADMLEQRLANVKGVKNNVRAKFIAAALRTSADALKAAGSGAIKTWTLFESKFSAELAEVAGKRPPKEDFKIK